MDGKDNKPKTKKAENQTPSFEFLDGESAFCQCTNHWDTEKRSKGKKCGKPTYFGSLFCLECQVRC